MESSLPKVLQNFFQRFPFFPSPLSSLAALISQMSALQSILATTGSTVGLGHMIHFNGGRFLGPYADVMP